MEINDKVIKEAYEIWRSHPTTGLLIQAINKHRSNYVDFLTSRSSDANTTDAQFRSYATGLKTIDAILEIITNYDKFVKQLEKPQ